MPRSLLLLAGFLTRQWYSPRVPLELMRQLGTVCNPVSALCSDDVRAVLLALALRRQSVKVATSPH